LLEISHKIGSIYRAFTRTSMDLSKIKPFMIVWHGHLRTIINANLLVHLALF
jgi:hypothetical protein